MKGNMVLHIESCNLIAERKSQRENNKVCPYCDKVFENKFNRDRHVTMVHFAEDVSLPVPLSFAIPDEQTNE